MINREGTAEWSATGLENQGVAKHGRSIRLLSAKTEGWPRWKGTGLLIRDMVKHARVRITHLPPINNRLIDTPIRYLDSRSLSYRTVTAQS